MFCRSTQDTAVLSFVSTVLTPIPLYYHRHRLLPLHLIHIYKPETNVNMLTNTLRSDSGLTFLFFTRVKVSLLHEKNP